MPLPQRKLPRLSKYDYSQNGCYFLTICTQNKIHLFGKVVDASVQLNQFGQIAQAELTAIPSHYSMVFIDHFVVMPNHVHILLTIDHETERVNPVPNDPSINQTERASAVSTDSSINQTERASAVSTDPSINEPERASAVYTDPSINEMERASAVSTDPSIDEMERASAVSTDPSINQTERASPFPTVSTIIGSYKSGVTNRIHQVCPEVTVWQKSFYDHIIRDETDYFSICRVYRKQSPEVGNGHLLLNNFV